MYASDNRQAQVPDPQPVAQQLFEPVAIARDRGGLAGGDAVSADQVVAGAEGAARAGDEGDVDGVVGLCLAERVEQLGLELARDRVQLLGSVQRDPRDASVALVVDRLALLSHRGASIHQRASAWGDAIDRRPCIGCAHVLAFRSERTFIATSDERRNNDDSQWFWSPRLSAPTCAGSGARGIWPRQMTVLWTPRDSTRRRHRRRHRRPHRSQYRPRIHCRDRCARRPSCGCRRRCTSRSVWLRDGGVRRRREHPDPRSRVRLTFNRSSALRLPHHVCECAMAEAANVSRPPSFRTRLVA